MLEKDNFDLKMKLFFQQELWANSKSDKEMAKEIVDLKVSGSSQSFERKVLTVSVASFRSK